MNAAFTRRAVENDGHRKNEEVRFKINFQKNGAVSPLGVQGIVSEVFN